MTAQAVRADPTSRRCRRRKQRYDFVAATMTALQFLWITVWVPSAPPSSCAFFAVGAFTTPTRGITQQQRRQHHHSSRKTTRRTITFARMTNGEDKNEGAVDAAAVTTESSTIDKTAAATTATTPGSSTQPPRPVQPQPQPQPPPPSSPRSQPQQRQRSRQGPTAQELMRAMGTSPRRIFLSLTSATGIALAGNLFGVTSQLLQRFPEDAVEATGIDAYYPRGPFKRCIGGDAKSGVPRYTYVVPKEWVADTFVALAQATRRAKSLDYQMSPTGSGRASTAPAVLPDTAYGPPGGGRGQNKQQGSAGKQQGDTNVSVIVTTGLRGLTLQGTLGPPAEAAETFLSKSLAPPGSGRVATLVNAFEDPNRSVYQFEYVVDRSGRNLSPLRSISVVAASPDGTALLTQTVVAPQRDWEGDGASYGTRLRKVASSFHLL